MALAKIGFIGLGVMGSSMAGHLLDAGYALTVYNRTRAKAEPLLARGAKWAASPAELAAGVDVVISMVGYPKDVEAIYFGEQGVLQTKQGGFVIDMTTSSPKLARRIFAAAQEKGVILPLLPCGDEMFLLSGGKLPENSREKRERRSEESQSGQ